MDFEYNSLDDGTSELEASYPFFNSVGRRGIFCTHCHDIGTALTCLREAGISLDAALKAIQDYECKYIPVGCKRYIRTTGKKIGDKIYAGHDFLQICAKMYKNCA